jgi:nucleoside-triphosphatase
MSPAFLLTGTPGSGKTTAIRKILSDLPCEAGGFYTEEIREAGRRLGFRMITLDGRRGVLAHVDIPGSARISKYGVDVTLVDTLGVECLEKALDERKLVVIDEIGPMEILSARFRNIVLEILRRNAVVLGSVVRRRMEFTDHIKELPGVQVIEINRGNWAHIVDRVSELIHQALTDLG